MRTLSSLKTRFEVKFSCKRVSIAEEGELYQEKKKKKKSSSRKTEEVCDLRLIVHIMYFSEFLQSRSG